MSRYDEWRKHESRLREYESRLRKTVLHSADVLPEKVSNYLNEVANSDCRNAKKQVFQEYQPLVDHLTKHFVDFAIKILIKAQKKPITLVNRVPRRITTPPEEDLNLGIESEVAQEQAPFLCLLRRNEDEGLRLIQTLTNTVAAKLREREQSLLPVVINLPSGVRNFFGNREIYYCYHPYGSRPDAVVSALTALKVWMKEQVEAGRDAETLFEKVLNSSNCVASLSVCMSVALAYPEKCMKAALPLICSPVVWEMEGMRLRDIQQFAASYMLSEDDSLQTPFQQAVARFTEDLPFLYKGEQEDPSVAASLRERMENIQIFADLANYRQRQVGDSVEIWVEPPQHIRMRNEKQLAPIFESQPRLSLNRWVQKTIDEGKPAEGMTLKEAVAAAQQFQQPDDFSASCTTEYPHNQRLYAIAGVAAAILITDFEWTQHQGLVVWSRDILLAAACMPDSADSFRNLASSLKILAARGLGVLVEHGAADTDVREQFLRFVSVRDKQVVEAAFQGLFKAWVMDEVVCWNALSLGLSLCLLPTKLAVGTPVGLYGVSFAERADWTELLVNKHLNNLKKHEVAELPRIPPVKDIVFLDDLARCVLHALPFSDLTKNPTAKMRLLRLADDLMAWTLERNALTRDPHYNDNLSILYWWNQFFPKWLSRLTRALTFEEARQHVLVPLRDSWSKVPELTANLLDGYISNHIAYMKPLTLEAQAGWREICNWVLESPEIANCASRPDLNQTIGDVVQLIIFRRNGKSRIRDDWSHTSLFSDIIDKWVRVVGHNPYAYTHLVVMLDGLGWQFAPEPALEWLNQCVNASIHEFWQERSNGQRTAELLHQMWNNHEKQIRSNPITLQRYSDLVDRLVGAGIALAGELQKKLEKREG
jgi:hypothetical protein